MQLLWKCSPEYKRTDLRFKNHNSLKLFQHSVKHLHAPRDWSDTSTRPNLFSVDAFQTLISQRKLRSKDAVWLCENRNIHQMSIEIFIACCLQLFSNSDVQLLLCRVNVENKKVLYYMIIKTHLWLKLKKLVCILSSKFARHIIIILKQLKIAAVSANGNFFAV